jgi:hypothetical protein
MKKLFVAGCSISDRTQVTHSYGDFVAAHFGIPFVNLAGGAGSNKRCIRLVVENVRSGNLTSDDLLIFQWIEPARTELHSPSTLYIADSKEAYENNIKSIEEKRKQIPENFVGRIPCLNPIYDIVAEKYPVTRFKPQSHTWMGSERDASYHLSHERNGIISELAFYEMSLQYEMLEGYLHSKNIPFISLWRRNEGAEIPSMIRDLFDIDLVRKNDIVLSDIWEEYNDPHWHSPINKKYWLDPDDPVHFSIEGHIEAANHICAHLQHRGLA